MILRGVITRQVLIGVKPVGFRFVKNYL